MDVASFANLPDASSVLLSVITSTVIVNLLVIYKAFAYIRGTSNQSSRAKHFIIISLAFGEIFVALCPLANTLYSLRSGVTDLEGKRFSIMDFEENTAFLSNNVSFLLLYFFAPFVKAAGLFLLTLESLFFWSQDGSSFESQRASWGYRLLLAGIPWMFGAVGTKLITIFSPCAKSHSPSNTMAHMQCFYVSVVGFSGLLLLHFTIYYAFVYVNDQNTNTEIASLTLLKKQCSPGLHANLYCEVMCKHDEITAKAKSNVMASTGSSNICGEDHDSDAVSSHCVYTFDIDNESIQFLIFDNKKVNIVTKYENKPKLITQDQDKSSLLANAVVFCVCSVPAAIVSLIVLINEQDFVPFSIIYVLETLYRLYVLRSLLSPLVWLYKY